MRKQKWLLIFIFTLLTVFIFADTGIKENLKKKDSDQNGMLTEKELREYFLEFDPKVKALRKNAETLAGDNASDLFEVICKGCNEIKIELIEKYLSNEGKKSPQGKKPAKGKKRGIAIKGFEIKRDIIDVEDPRNSTFKVPMIFSLKSEKKEDNKTEKSLTILGSIQFFKFQKTIKNSESSLYLVITPGIQMDINGADPTCDTTVNMSLPLTLIWIPKSGFSMRFTFSPSFITDREFRRSIWEGSIITVVSLESIRAGYWEDIPKSAPYWLRLFWLPKINIEWGKIIDPAGNIELEKLAMDGGYLRFAPGISFMLIPEKISKKLRLNIDYYHRWDFKRKWNRGFLSAAMTYDLSIGDNASSGVFLTLTYQRGLKPPDFKKTDLLLFGIGIIIQ